MGRAGLHGLREPQRNVELLALLAGLEARQAQVGEEGRGQAPAAAALVGLRLPGIQPSFPNLARAVAQLPHLRHYGIKGFGAVVDCSLQGFAEKVVEPLARCPSLRHLLVLGKRQSLWAWSAQALRGPGVRCEFACDAFHCLKVPFEVAWPSVGEASELDVLAAVQGMADSQPPIEEDGWDVGPPDRLTLTTSGCSPLGTLNVRPGPPCWGRACGAASGPAWGSTPPSSSSGPQWTTWMRRTCWPA
jgi:hypothetical protein